MLDGDSSNTVSNRRPSRLFCRSSHVAGASCSVSPQGVVEGELKVEADGTVGREQRVREDWQESRVENVTSPRDEPRIMCSAAFGT